MKVLVYPAIIAIVASTPVFGADTVSLVGTWTGQETESPRPKAAAAGLQR